MCPIPNGFRAGAMDVIARKKERQDALRRVGKCTDVDDGIFENILY
jgi:hypothetical protein